MAALPKFISISEAAKKIHVSVEDLRPFIEKERLMQQQLMERFLWIHIPC